MDGVSRSGLGADKLRIVGYIFRSAEYVYRNVLVFIRAKASDQVFKSRLRNKVIV